MKTMFVIFMIVVMNDILKIFCNLWNDVLTFDVLVLFSFK